MISRIVVFLGAHVLINVLWLMSACFSVLMIFDFLNRTLTNTMDISNYVERAPPKGIVGRIKTLPSRFVYHWFYSPLAFTMHIAIIIFAVVSFVIQVMWGMYAHLDWMYYEGLVDRIGSAVAMYISAFLYLSFGIPSAVTAILIKINREPTETDNTVTEPLIDPSRGDSEELSGGYGSTYLD